MTITVNRRWGTAVLAAIAAVLVAVFLAACSHPENAIQMEQQQQASDLASMLNNQPLPHFNWSLQRQVLIDAETAAARGYQSTSFFFIQGVRDPVFVCPSLGLGVPDTAQLSNPQQIAPVTGKWGGGSAVLPQADPYGIYAPSSSEGTFVICVGSNGQPYLHRAEEFVDTVMGPARWDYKTHTELVTGAPTYRLRTHQ